MGIRVGDLGLGERPNRWFSQPFYNLICTVKPYKRCLACHWHPNVRRPSYYTLAGFLITFRWGPVLRFALFSVFSFDVATDTYKTDGCQVRLIRPNRATSHFVLFLKDFKILRMSSIVTASIFCPIWSVAENETHSKLNEPSHAASERLNEIDWTFISLQRSANRGLDIILVVSVKLNLTLLQSW